MILSGSDDTPTLWHAVGGDVMNTRVDGLFEPYSWKPGIVAFRGRPDALDLDLGTYKLGDGQWRFGAATLDGFGGDYIVD